jgi:ABC-type branched-subunit amino acid transport system permease subunit
MSATIPITQPQPQADAPLPAAKRDIAPLLLAPALALAVLPFVSLPTWITLTVAGLAMGMMIFIMASGLTLVFGLMSVLNFGHGAFVSVGAFSATMVLLPMRWKRIRWRPTSACWAWRCWWRCWSLPCWAGPSSASSSCRSTASTSSRSWSPWAA